MNILHHKSWHVYNVKNIEKVKRDEEKANLEEEKKTEKAIQADREARLSILRSKAKIRYFPNESPTSNEVLNSSSSMLDTKGHIPSLDANVSHSLSSEASSTLPLTVIPPSKNKPSAEVEQNNLDNGHFSLFQKEFEAQKKGNQVVVEGNPEYLAEKKAKDDKWEKQITMYLDKGVKGKGPWYTQEEVEKEKSSKDMHRKLKDDPLTSMNKFLDKKKAIKERESEEERKLMKRRKHSPKKAITESSKQKKKDQHKKHQKEECHRNETKNHSLELLRQQRLEREANERRKASKLIGIARAEDFNSGSVHGTPRHYNNQFNPNLSRQNRG